MMMNARAFALAVMTAAAVAQKCTLCPGGISPPNISLFVQEAGTTCGDLEYEATMSLDCAESTKYSTACSCGACFSICPDGSSISMEQNNTVVGVATDGKSKTCGDIQASFIEGEQDQERCYSHQQIGVHACGCDGSALPEPKCTLCENGQVPTNFLSDLGNGNLCFEFSAFLVHVDDVSECSAFQATAGVYCGCENPVASASACRFCGGLLPDPARVPDESTGFSCSELEYAANTPYGDCFNMQSMFRSACCGPEFVDPNDNDSLPYADDTYFEATSPPVFRPTEQSSMHEDVASSAKRMCTKTTSVAVIFLPAILLL